MKQVVIPVVNDNWVSIDTVSIDKYYGIEKVHKCPVVRSHYKTGNFVALSPIGLTNANGCDLSNEGFNKLKDFLTAAIKEGWIVKEFDTAKELFKWLSE